jgi:hypothetical protein
MKMTKNLEEADSYLKSLFTKLNEIAEEQNGQIKEDNESYQEAQKIIEKIKKAKRASKLRTLFRILLLILLLIGLGILFWDELSIQLIFMLRWVVVLVS